MLLLFIVKNYKPEKHYSNADTDKLKILFQTIKINPVFIYEEI